jgi:transmembrane sensor
MARCQPAARRRLAQVSAAHEQSAALAEEGPLLALRQQLRWPAQCWPARRAAAPGDDRRHGLALVGTPLAAYSIHAWNAAHTRPQSRASPMASRPMSPCPMARWSRSTPPQPTGGAFRRGRAPCVWKVRAGFASNPLPRHGGSRRVGQTFTAAQGSYDLRTDPGQLRAYAESGLLNLGEDNAALLRRAACWPSAAMTG